MQRRAFFAMMINNRLRGRSKQYEPKLVDLLAENIVASAKIREQFPNNNSYDFLYRSTKK
jgi:hypothetical protein